MKEKLDEEEALNRKRANERQEENDERRENFYGPANSKSGQKRRPKVYLFGLNDLDNEEVISMVELTPTYKRSKEILGDIKNKAKGNVAVTIDTDPNGNGAVITFG